MENQHQHIKGYRDLSEAEIAAMNSVKGVAEDVRVVLDAVSAMEGVDQRWVSIARTQLQQGFMSLTRAVAQPTTF